MLRDIHGTPVRRGSRDNGTETWTRDVTCGLALQVHDDRGLREPYVHELLERRTHVEQQQERVELEHEPEQHGEPGEQERELQASGGGPCEEPEALCELEEVEVVVEYERVWHHERDVVMGQVQEQDDGLQREVHELGLDAEQDVERGVVLLSRQHDRAQHERDLPVWLRVLVLVPCEP